jgi:TonB-linked SusC/RagA family outer membrane protein
MGSFHPSTASNSWCLLPHFLIGPCYVTKPFPRSSITIQFINMVLNVKRLICLPGLCLFFMLFAGIRATGAPGDNDGYYFQDEDHKNYKGRVVSAAEQPFVKAKVKNLNTGVSVETDKAGYFTIAASPGDSIQVEIKGFKTLTSILEANLALHFVMESVHPDVIEVIGRPRAVERIYTTVPRHLSLASTEAVYNNDIIKSPVTSFNNTLTGRIAGLNTFQFSGQPGADGATLSLRGQAPLVMIDGVVANLTIFNLEDIESATLIKDALGTAMLGVRGSNGVLAITTRKGRAHKQQISFTVQTAIQRPIGAPKTLGAYDYARLYNEAAQNDGLPALYTEADLTAYKAGTDPYGHPDVDWRKEVLKSSSRFDRYSLHATGGNSFARYYVSLEHVNQTGFFIKSDRNKYNTNNDFKTYVIRSNTDVSVNKKLTGGIYLLGRILSGNEPGFSTNNILTSLLFTPNNAYPARNANGSFGGNQQFQNNLLAQTTGSGYRTNYKRDMLATFYLKHTLDDITPGLWAQVKASYSAGLSENVIRAKTFAVYQQITTPSGTTYNQYGTDGAQGNSNLMVYQGRNDYQELSIGYDKVFKSKHGVNVLVLANRDNSVLGSDLPYTITGTSGRIAYNYEGKYVAEAAFGYNGSNRYPENGATKRGFFPAVGLGWNMEKENFLKNNAWLTRLKLSASYGATGWDDPGYFTYIQRYNDASSVYFGTGAGTATAITEQAFVNRNTSWEKAKKLNIGVEGSVFKNRLGFSFEYYNNTYYDLLMQRGRSIAMIGNDYPNENIGRNRNMGFETRLSWQQIGTAFQYFVALNVTVQRSEVLFMDEVDRPYDWMKRTGQRVGQAFGYIAEGLFKDQTEINNSATTVGYTPQPGDIKYKDLNNDGVIDQFDVAPIGNKVPSSFFGFSLGAQWKGFDVSALVQGAWNRDVALGGVNIWAFQNGGSGQAYAHNLDRWTPATAATATQPRLNIGNNPNNQVFSSFWLKKGDYLRLKNIELGYSLPASLIKHVRLQSIRLFARGYNLVTIASSELYDRDPEVLTGFFYPNQKLYNFGITVKL